MRLPSLFRSNASRALEKLRDAARRFADPFTILLAEVEVSAAAFATARAIRGEKHPPAIMVHGVMQRSGTRYFAELMKLHPDVCVYPRGLIETPILRTGDSIRSMQARFLGKFPLNRRSVGADHRRACALLW